MGEMQVFGAASDFYRARVIVIDETIPSELDWRDDVLIKEPSYRVRDKQHYRVEIVSLDDGSTAVAGEHKSLSTAERHRGSVAEDIKDLTKQEFEAKYKLR